jgi:hypothetical protein
MNIDNDPLSLTYGLFDYPALLNQAGIVDAGQIANFNTAVAAVDAVKSTSLTSVMDSISSVKDLLKGDFFA